MTYEEFIKWIHWICEKCNCVVDGSPTSGESILYDTESKCSVTGERRGVSFYELVSSLVKRLAILLKSVS